MNIVFFNNNINNNSSTTTDNIWIILVQIAYESRAEQINTCPYHLYVRKKWAHFSVAESVCVLAERFWYSDYT